MRTFNWHCRYGFHFYGTNWANIAPVSGGGPASIIETCQSCGHVRKTTNRRH